MSPASDKSVRDLTSPSFSGQLFLEKLRDALAELGNSDSFGSIVRLAQAEQGA